MLETDLQIAFVAGIVLTAAVVAGVLTRRQSRKNRELIDYLGKRIEDLEQSIAENLTKLKNGSRGIAEHGRKIAWLEAKIRHPRSHEEEEEGDAHLMITEARPSITEKRHRVFKLAARGHDAPTIANTLGMMSGEVELIMDLKKAAA